MKRISIFLLLLTFINVNAVPPRGLLSVSNQIDQSQSQDESTITIATFNIQIFGKTKSAKELVMDTLAMIIRSYDIVAVQEIKNKPNKVPTLFLNKINENGAKYAMVLSERTGMQADDKSSQEQYAYYYNTETIKSLDEGVLYDDSSNDFFQREPFLAGFSAIEGSFTFVLSSIHTRPSEAKKEIAALHDVVNWAKNKYPDEDDFITLGDFNASCSYASPEDLDQMELRGAAYQWIVPDDADTNLASKVCAYDRIVITTGVTSDFTGQWGVDNAFTSKVVSDHFPVWAEFYTNKD
ncbi:MAG: endonuclease/exonuclease/phosphatase family protein [Reichenbachiella sp.]|uniref:endonuclease/exonuclease/phosphatase family protein n=1 Tax=Reichenbachiella sp. TaxID=2184521 RepID=UPI00329A7329